MGEAFLESLLTAKQRHFSLLSVVRISRSIVCLIIADCAFSEAPSVLNVSIVQKRVLVMGADLTEPIGSVDLASTDA